MRKFISGCVLGLFAAMPLTHAQDAKAKSILDAVTKKVNSMKSLKASFTMNLSGKVKDSKDGTISLKGQKYHVTISGQEIICDTKTVWTYTKDTKEVQISAYNPSEQSISPAKLLTNFYDKEYSYSYKGEKKNDKGKNCDLIELTPNDKSKKIVKIELLVDKASTMITSGTFTDKNGNKYNYSVSNITPNVNIPDAFFTWAPNEHPGVETVDLR